MNQAKSRAISVAIFCWEHFGFKAYSPGVDLPGLPAFFHLLLDQTSIIILFMVCPYCQQKDVNNLNEMFNAERAQRNAREYLAHGLDRRAQKLAALVTTLAGVPEQQPLRLLDVGCGAGGLHHELLRQGIVQQATGVDASAAFIAAARENAGRLRLTDAVSYFQQDFAQNPGVFEPADVVVMDRVICCYPYLQQLLGAAAARARRLLVISFPFDDWWVRWPFRLLDAALTLVGSGYHPFLHPLPDVLHVAAQHGLKPISQDRHRIWRIMAFARQA